MSDASELFVASDVDPAPVSRILPPVTQPSREREGGEGESRRRRRKKKPESEPEEKAPPEGPKGRRIDIRA